MGSAPARHPARATISEMGLLLSRMLGLNDTQEGVSTLVFKIADDNGRLGRRSKLRLYGNECLFVISSRSDPRV